MCLMPIQAEPILAAFAATPDLNCPISEIASTTPMLETRAHKLPNFIIAGAPKSRTPARLTPSAANRLPNTDPIDPVA